MPKTAKKKAAKKPSRDSASLAKLIDNLETSAREEREAQPVDERHLVLFRLDAEEYAISIQMVREILRVPKISRVPGGVRHVRGVINVRGQVMPVVEIRRLLDLEPLDLTGRSRVLVLEIGERIVGMLVDEVTQVLRIPATSVTGGEEAAARTACIEGVAQWNERLIILLDVARALELEAA